jgi:hypothetical protein
MSKLDADQRNSMSSGTFGLPAERKYPMPDASHAADAKARATQQYDKGDLSGSQRSEIDAKANAKLGQHPRQHSLAMASADTLHKAGYISDAHHKAIRGHAGKKLDAHKAAKESSAYGSLAPMDKQP